MSKDKGPDIKIVRELIEDSGTAAAASVDGVSRVIDFKIDGDVDKGEAEISIYIDVVFGYKIPAVSWDVQYAVKSAVKTAVGYDVKTIDIHIQGVDKAIDKKGKDK
ncbi:MAG: Asp23/Gls24 family envelope stress response protein [Firmicutes bacterium]|jgi:uncharacterized alkaline shock family protein YloU|nr:Asp23/Gls24 family envelope stress response protein [Bacillota bacterium]MBQ6607979.1 Asp23/Gls24 family envelope stress response protein [Bacillota bacterium]MBR3260204.1 Asp23/Gls24 family envelope stress response protein [Bacillota bacterium]MBR3375314.1 Asp23/Gls24 family envelope stress response protein [Bacillota bacterium]MBR6225204.1 Asp23/Gls24 family envelope stress response protein [Bacillota bacterium]